MNCKQIVSVNIPSSVISIGYRAFYNCQYMTKVSIPANVKEIGINAFCDCPNLTIYGYTGSSAEKYAIKEKINFVSIGYVNNGVDIASSGIVVGRIRDKTYTGNAIKPNPVIKYNGVTLIKNVDYVLSYKNNTDIGKGTVLITGKGNYSGSREETFKIVFNAKTKLNSVGNKTINKLQLKWSKVPGASGYIIYRSSNGATFSQVKKVGATAVSWVDTGVKNYATCYYKVCAYRVENGTTLYGANSDVKSNSVLKSTDIKDYVMNGNGGYASIKQLITAVGSMKAGNNPKYPDLYYTGRNIIIGYNDNPTHQNNEFTRIENWGNTTIRFYEAKIGDTRAQMESKFQKYYMRTWDGGKTYSNSNGFSFYPTFRNGRLSMYVYVCKPTDH